MHLNQTLKLFVSSSHQSCDFINKSKSNSQKRYRRESVPGDKIDHFDSLPDDIIISILCKSSSFADRPAELLNILSICKRLNGFTSKFHNTKDSSVRLAYEAQPRPKAIAALSETTVTKVACGTTHTVAVDSNGFVYTWGFGGYGRLGHREQKDEWVQQSIDVFQRQNVLPPDVIDRIRDVTAEVQVENKWCVSELCHRERMQVRGVTIRM